MSAGTLTQGQPMATRNDHYVLRIFETLKRSPSRPVVYWRDEIIAAGKLHDAILDAAAALRRAGVDATRPLAILTEPNHPCMLIARYAAHLLGAPVVHVRSMNPRSDAETFSLAVQLEILRDTEAKVLLVDDADADRGEAALAGVAGLTVLHGLDRGRAEPCPGPAADAPTSWRSSTSPAAAPAARRWSSSSSAPVRRSIDLLATGLERGRARHVAVGDPDQPHDRADGRRRAGRRRHGRAARGASTPTTCCGPSPSWASPTSTWRCPHLYRLLDHPRRRDVGHVLAAPASPTAAPRPRPRGSPQAVEVFGDVLIQVYGTTEAGGITSLNAAGPPRTRTARARSAARSPGCACEIRATRRPRGRAARIGEVWINVAHRIGRLPRRAGLDRRRLCRTAGCAPATSGTGTSTATSGWRPGRRRHQERRPEARPGRRSSGTCCPPAGASRRRVRRPRRGLGRARPRRGRTHAAVDTRDLRGTSPRRSPRNTPRSASPCGTSPLNGPANRTGPDCGRSPHRCGPGRGGRGRRAARHRSARPRRLRPDQTPAGPPTGVRVPIRATERAPHDLIRPLRPVTAAAAALPPQHDRPDDHAARPLRSATGRSLRGSSIDQLVGSSPPAASTRSSCTRAALRHIARSGSPRCR